MVLAVVVIPLLLGEPKYVEEEEEAPKSTKFESKIQPLPGSAGNGASLNDAQKSQIQDGGGLVLKKLDDQPARKTAPTKKQGAPVTIKPLDMQEAITTGGDTAAEPVVKAIPKAKPETGPKTAPKAKPKPVATELKSGWVVQVGVYSKSENATAVAASLKGIGYAPKVSDIKNKPGMKRVWIGPYASKNEAQNTSKKLAGKRGDGGYVKEYPF